MIKALLKHYWFVLIALPVFMYFYLTYAFDQDLAKDLFLRKSAIALYSLLLAYIVRRSVLGYIEWEGAWRYVYAIVIHIIIALAIIFG